MSTPTPSQGEGANGAGAGNDSSFDSFIDSNLILETNSPGPTPASPTKTGRESNRTKAAPASLSALPSRLTTEGNSVQGGLNSPSVHEFLNYSHTSSSTVTTPTTSSSSTLHNLNFDFFDPHGGDGPTVANPSRFSSETDGRAPAEVSNSPSFGDTSMHSPIIHPTSSTNHAFSWSTPNSFFPMPLPQPITRSVDDLGHNSGHQAVHHHQRSLSLRDVAPPPPDGISIESLTSLPFPSVKMEQDSHGSFSGSLNETIPSPTTEDHSSPSSSAVSSSLFDQGSPRQEKKRRLDSPSESLGSSQSVKSAKSASMAKSNTSSGHSKKGSGANRRSRASTMIGKAATPASATNSLGFSASSLIENMTTAMPITSDHIGAPTDAVQAGHHLHRTGSQQSALPEPQMTAFPGNNEMQQGEQGAMDGYYHDQSSSASKPCSKRPPPSASQVTESGQPFPVIDTSAKHSSLFVPPDTSGLTKREARLVKNRAAAFLSRQRKREQFEELEVKCKNLCRLVWRFWEIVAGPNDDVGFGEKYNNTRILPIVLEEEVEEVKEVLEMVVALKGGSVAPTEDGQLQGAVAAGLNSANGKLIPDASATTSGPTTAARAPAAYSTPVVGAARPESGEIARLQAELEESKKRESALQAELAQERSIRMSESYQRDVSKPFKGGKQDEALSLTVSPKYDEEGEEENGRDRLEGGRRRGSGRGGVSGRSGPPRTSERLQRQQSQLALASATSAANGGQRKAAGAALMMVLFSFALFGLPHGQMSRVGGITRAGSTDEFSAGKVLGAPLTGAQYGQEDDDEEMMDFDLTCKQAPSSHLSAKDLLPPMPDMADLLDLEDARHEEDKGSRRPYSISRSFQDVLGGEGGDEENSVDYKAFAKDLGTSLDWDVQRGFLVIGGDEEEEGRGKQEGEQGAEEEDRAKENDEGSSSEAPTKLTLFVPAPDMSGDMLDAEDRFYDAPLASADAVPSLTSTTVRSNKGPKREESGSESSSNNAQTREMTQAEATRAALRVLRNHRIASEAAALATSRRLGQKPSPSQRLTSPHQRKQHQQQGLNSKGKTLATGSGSGKATTGVDGTEAGSGASTKMDVEADEEQDFSKEVMESANPADKIRGTDFYQLEFSLSGAKVRNVAELAKLLGVMRNKKE